MNSSGTTSAFHDETMKGKNSKEYGVIHDLFGYPVKTISDDCMESINSFYHQFLNYGRGRSVILQAPVHDEHCVLGNVYSAHFLAGTSSVKSLEFLNKAKACLENATLYEKAVFKVVSYLLHSEKDDDIAYKMHSEHLVKFPRDLVSLKRAQVLCFYMGRPDLSLDIVKQVLMMNMNESYIYGMHSFPLLELGRIKDAEEAARKGLYINKQDIWSQHNLCHVFQYENRFKEAVEFMIDCSSSWNSCSSFLYTHNWWHVAVCYLEGNAPISKVLEVYDQNIWKELQKNDTFPAEVYLNALALLLRVYVRGQIGIFDDRLKILADCLTDQSAWLMEWHLDVLILWALACTNKITKGEELLKAMKSRFYSMSIKKQRKLQKGIALAETLFEYGKGNYEKAFELIGPEFDYKDFKVIGASDEQLDVFNEVWFCILLESGRFHKAIEEIEKRIKDKEEIPFLWRLLERGCSMAGKENTHSVSQKASALEVAYFDQFV